MTYDPTYAYWTITPKGTEKLRKMFLGKAFARATQAVEDSDSESLRLSMPKFYPTGAIRYHILNLLLEHEPGSLHTHQIVSHIQLRRPHPLIGLSILYDRTVAELKNMAQAGLIQREQGG